MCGICGIITGKEKSIDESRVRAMMRAMSHRGPDDEGIYSSKMVCLGHRRLSIIDLSSAGHQPLPNEDKTVWVVLNGEIYNYLELMEQLEKEGHTFRSKSDTEVLVHLYEECGKECVKFIVGMYAFAVWDSRRSALLLARDRIGKKPLIYSQKNGEFCFASEFNALIESNSIEKDINPEAVNYYLTFGYIPAPMTIYKNVFKLQPGHTLWLENQRIEINKYWNLDFKRKNNLPFNEALEECERLIQEAVRIRLNSDVPLGVFLSGGIDSSLVAGIMAKLSGQRIRTFSIGFDESSYNELSYARNIARRFNAEHQEFMVRPRALNILPILVERYGEPFADPSCIPTYYLAQMSKQHVSVVLNGDGGDELFAGYERYQAAIYSRFFDGIPYFLRRALRFTAERLNLAASGPRSRTQKLKRFFKAIDLPLPERYMQWIAVVDCGLKQRLFTPDFLKASCAHKAESLFMDTLSDSSMHLLDRILKLDTITYLPDDLLVKSDIATMSHALEARSPFLDHRLLEFSATLPASYKLRCSTKKFILKKIAERFIPKENVHRPKHGFGVPVGEWLRGELRCFLFDNVLDANFIKAGYFNQKILKEIVEQHISEKANYGELLWALLMFSLWQRKFIWK